MTIGVDDGVFIHQFAYALSHVLLGDTGDNASPDLTAALHERGNARFRAFGTLHV